ncbi:hypothetical protein [Legionella worsleiensis]|uniref:Interaptin n=1 Tax=Legionella worsleiensis TaxID=45076 RepID=A0A0W1AHF7_9GAMM|nr:hypothetical protein [Legionella worsleiensis]KTD80729.1 interaptin [Legionella worsleiensis]STY32693.1 interaptin [Legionella worsleiensis]
MAKNQAISQAIKNTQTQDDDNRAKGKQVLEALLKANPDDLNAFRQVIIESKDYWQRFSDLHDEGGESIYENNDELLTLEGPPDVKSIRQSAAQQRVLMGLKEAADDVLIAILTHNEDECRAYLAAKPELGRLNQSHGWLNDEALARNKSVDILPGKAIEEIRHQARDSLLLSLIAKVQNKDNLLNILNAKDEEGLQRAAQAINYPESACPFLTYPLSDSVNQAINVRLQDLALISLRAASNHAKQHIHNAAVARILVGFTPEIVLTLEQVDLINQELDQNALKNYGSDFHSCSLYKGIVDKIKEQCGSVHEGQFYEAFGLEQDGTAFKQPSLIKDAIVAQNDFNQYLLSRYFLIKPQDAQSEQEKRLLEIFLTLEKETRLDPVKVFSEFKKAQTYAAFVERIKPNKTSNLPTQLKTLLPASVFYQMKNEALERNLRSTDSTTVSKALVDLEGVIHFVHQNNDLATQTQNRYQFMESIEPYHLYNPAFKDKAFNAQEMKTQYQLLATDCNLMVEQLRRDLNRLKSLPRPNLVQDPGLSNEITTKAQELNQQLTDELETLNSNLQFYEKMQQKLSGTDGIVQAINDAQDSKKSYKFYAHGIMRRIVSPDELAKLPYTSQPPTGINSESSSEEQEKNELTDFIPQGKIAAVDYVKTDYDTDMQTKKFEAVGRYTVDRSISSRMTLKEDKLTKTPGVKFEIIEFPKQTFPNSGENSLEGAKLQKAKMDFSLALAAEALASFGTPPTKEKPLRLYGADQEQMRYLWTALIILGEKNPQMNITPETISLDRFGNNSFDPAKEKSSFLGFSTGFSKNSLYHQFKEEMKADKKRISKVDTKAVAAAKSLKDELAVFRKTAAINRTMEGKDEHPESGLKKS